MELSAKMPAQMDSTLPAKREASMPAGGTPGDSGPMVAANSPISQKNSGGVAWGAVAESGPKWETADKKTGSEWELTDRKEA